MSNQQVTLSFLNSAHRNCLRTDMVLKNEDLRFSQHAMLLLLTLHQPHLEKRVLRRDTNCASRDHAFPGRSMVYSSHVFKAPPDQQRGLFFSEKGLVMSKA